MNTPTENKVRQVVILDTSAFVAGFDPFSLPQEQVTVPKVEEEIKRNSMVKMRFEMAIESGKVKVKEPSQEAISKMEAYANKVGDTHKLSEADKQLLALTIDLKIDGYTPQIITDDYSIQNTASNLGIPYRPVSQKGINAVFVWSYRCTGCRKVFDKNLPECPVCGAKLKSHRAHR